MLALKAGKKKIVLYTSYLKAENLSNCQSETMGFVGMVVSNFFLLIPPNGLQILQRKWSVTRRSLDKLNGKTDSA